MNLRHAVPAAAAALACLATAAAPASAADPAADLPPLATRLSFATTTWTSQGAEMSVLAPRSWSFVLTPDGQARFNAAERPDVLTMGYRGDGPLAPQLASKRAALRGTPGLRILTARGGGSGDAAHGELRYLWTPEPGETRFVAYRYRGDDADMVAGRLVDRRGLMVVLGAASTTGECS
jgi:hypothetical protein